MTKEQKEMQDEITILYTVMQAVLKKLVNKGVDLRHQLELIEKVMSKWEDTETDD